MEELFLGTYTRRAPEATWLLANGPPALEALRLTVDAGHSQFLGSRLPESDSTEKSGESFSLTALCLLDPAGVIVSWSAGAQAMYRCESSDAIGKHVELLFSEEEVRPSHHLQRAVTEGHFATEGWRLRQDGTRFWANEVTMVLVDRDRVAGFARVVRDFSEQHEVDEKICRSRSRQRAIPPESTVSGILSGELNRIPEANDAFLNLTGYSREDLSEGRIPWPELTPAEYWTLDRLAHEEALRFGACTPYEKEILCKDGTRAPVLISMAVLELVPFRWITFVQDLRSRNRMESIVDEDVDLRQSFTEIVGTSAPLKR